MKKNYGFDESLEKEHSSSSDYIFLGATKITRDKEVNSSGDWTDYLPELEEQKNNVFDSFSCVSFSHNNCLETIHKKLYGEEINYSDRFMSKVSGTIPGRGNSQIKVADSARELGHILEEFYPFSTETTKQEFFQTIPKELLDMGIEWFSKYEYGYERVRKENFKEAIKFSPIQVAVDSRTNKSNKVRSYNHSVMIYSLSPKPQIFDSYRNRVVEYDINYPFSYGMIFYYKKITEIKMIDPIIKTEYRFRLVKSDISPKIYLIDSDGFKHWIESPTDFNAIFGERALKEKLWDVLPFQEIDIIPEGKPIAIKNETIGEVLSNLFKIIKGK